MSSSNIAPAKKQTFSVAITTENYQNMIRNTLKDPKRVNRFIASITSAVAATPALQTCEPSSVLACGLLGEGLELSPSPQLGYFYIVPFKQKAKYREGRLISPECVNAQFILGYKGYIQLALRSGQYRAWLGSCISAHLHLHRDSGAYLRIADEKGYALSQYTRGQAEARRSFVGS